MKAYVKDKMLEPFIVSSSGMMTMKFQAQDGLGLNDFCIYQDKNKVWHIFSISWHGAERESDFRSFLAHATANSLTGPWKREPYIYFGLRHAFSPYIFPYKNHKAIMLLDNGHDLSAYVADENDLSTWAVFEKFEIQKGARDGMILREKNTYYLYATKSPNAGIQVFKSTNPLCWEKAHEILLGRNNYCDESPFVMKKNNKYYLWTTWSSRNYYRGIPSRVFCSEYPDFRDLSSTEEENSIKSFPIHAIEIIKPGEDEYIGQTGTGGPGILLHKIEWDMVESKIEADISSVSLKGRWMYSCHGYAYNCHQGNSVEYSFEGTRIEWYGHKSAGGGKAEIYIDGIKMACVDFYARQDPETAVNFYPEAFHWTSDRMTHGRHHFKAVICNRENVNSNRKYIYFKKLIISVIRQESEKTTG